MQHNNKNEMQDYDSVNETSQSHVRKLKFRTSRQVFSEKQAFVAFRINSHNQIPQRCGKRETMLIIKMIAWATILDEAQEHVHPLSVW